MRRPCSIDISADFMDMSFSSRIIAIVGRNDTAAAAAIALAIEPSAGLPALAAVLPAVMAAAAANPPLAEARDDIQLSPAGHALVGQHINVFDCIFAMAARAKLLPILMVEALKRIQFIVSSDQSPDVNIDDNSCTASQVGQVNKSLRSKCPAMYLGDLDKVISSVRRCNRAIDTPRAFVSFFRLFGLFLDEVYADEPTVDLAYASIDTIEKAAQAKTIMLDWDIDIDRINEAFMKHGGSDRAPADVFAGKLRMMDSLMRLQQVGSNAHMTLKDIRARYIRPAFEELSVIRERER